ncbi:MAG: hypothetical protein M3014_11600 [Chloroflexota bacterium]|nr:hypothetical protein [Chloroflexota bacterium]
MEALDRAFLARLQRDTTEEKSQTRLAYDWEAAAASVLRDDFTAEPSRSILYKGAASIALQAGFVAEAARMIHTALMGNPPPEIAEELHDLLEAVNFKRHLQLKNVTLEPSQLQLSITGDEVGSGVALSDVLVDRIKIIEKLVIRTAERLLGIAYRAAGSPKSSTELGYSLYMSVPRPGSFSVTLQVGRQFELPGLDLPGSVVSVVDEVVADFALLNEGNEEGLRQRIQTESYYRNFVGLAKGIAPDGKAVNMVGLTSVNQGVEKSVAITRKREELSIMVASATKDPESNTDNLTTLRGTLRFADATKNKGKIKIVTEDGKTHSLVVPVGLDDIVNTMWNNEVVVQVRYKGKSALLEDIDPA